MTRPRVTFALLLLALIVCPTAARAAGKSDEGAESTFRVAREYTVRVRASVDTPFLGDEQGAWFGAGFLVDAERGWIVTNAHVSGRAAADLQVAFYGEAFQSVRALYVDSFADIAVLQLDEPARNRRAAPIGRVVAPVVGEPVAVFGHPLGMPFTGSRGIVSGLTDQIGPDLIQIDATVDHGNSGGPVIGLRDGGILGIATAGAGDGKRDRLNFATPIADVQRILMLLRRGIDPSPPRLGFSLLKDEDDRHTMRVAAVFDPARWPFQPDDRIVSIQGERDTIGTLSDLVRQLRGRAGEIRMIVQRGKERLALVARPSSRPPAIAQRGVSIDGTLIAFVDTEDEPISPQSPVLGVHSVDPASESAAFKLEPNDMLVSVDGKRFTDVDTLADYAKAHGNHPIVLVFRRLTNDWFRTWEFHRREFPAKDVVRVPDPETPATASTD